MKKLLSSLLAACISLSLALPAAALDVEDAKALLQTYYVNGVPPEVMELDSLDEILEALGDPYTDYFTAEEYQDFLTFVNGETVVGIGVSISKEFHDGYELLSVLPGSPALEAGLKAGDVLTAVDGVPLTADPPPADLIQGEAGTKLTLTVRRKENGQLWNLSLKRREVTLPTVHYALEDGAAIIVCGSFGSTAADMMAQAILEMEPQSSVYLVDLRANPGGTSQSATTSSGLFIGSGIMAYFRHANGRYHYLDLPPNTPDLTDKPLVVLTSPHSASAAELFAAAVRDYNAGIAIGQRTYGKGIAQHVYDETTHPDLFDGDCLKITVYRFFSPKGTTNDTVGVIPTLLLSPENTPEAALLLSAPQPEQPDGSLKLELDGQTFYIELAKALEEANSAALTELLEAVPPSALLYRGVGNDWTEVTPGTLAAELGLPFVPRTFSDVSGAQFQREIDTLASYGLLSGYADGTFRPEDTITRAEFCAMISAALNFSPAAKAPTFSDVPAGSWYAAPIAAMAGRGFLSGYEDGTFHPNDTIAYEEMVCILDSVYAWASMEGERYAQSELTEVAEQMYASFSPWARHAARDLHVANALVGGLKPRDPGTRQAAAGMLCRLMESTNLLWH